MLQEDLRSMLNPIGQLLKQAGQLILEAETSELRIERKSDKNYVTAVDYAVQQYIQEQLRILTPAFGFMAEENDQAQQVLDRPVWILDPVDGTTNLMRHYQHSAISLALADGDQLLLGWIYNPFLDELFQAVRGQGATLNGRRIQVSSVTDLRDGLIGFGTTPYDRKQAHVTFERAEAMFLRALEIRRSGAAALDLAYVACGRLDGFFELNLQPWDVAAGLLMIEEAGGQLTDWQGNPHTIHAPASVLASNGSLHPILRTIITPA